MMVDLESFRPKNESFEHFFLKQVGRAYLFNQGIRCISTEVYGAVGHDHPPFGKKKSIIDVLGMDCRNRYNPYARQLKQRIEDKAIEIGRKFGIVDEFENDWVRTYQIRDEVEKTRIELTIDQCRTKACEELGYPPLLWDQIVFYRHTYEMRGIEVKVSQSDFRNGFSMIAEYSYVLAPRGIVKVEQLPAKVGLLEFDFDHYYVGDKWEDCLTLAKRPKKEYDSRFCELDGKKRLFKRTSHAEFCLKLLYIIAQQNTEEHIFWNPHIKQMKEGYNSPKMDHLFQLRIADRTPMGIVVERKWSKPKNYLYREDGEFYRLVQEGVGITGWMRLKDIIRTEPLIS